MGCWNGTCMISHLPIISGDEIKLIILHKQPYGRYENGLLNSAGYCYHNDLLSPSFLPINGKYDSYGCIESIEKDWNYNIIENYFKKTAKKIEVEDEVLEEFSLENILKGIERGSLKMLSEKDDFMKIIAGKALKVYKDADYIPEKQKEEYKKLAETDTSEKWRDGEFSYVLIRKDVWDHIVKSYVGEYWNTIDEKDERKYYITCEEWCKRTFEKAHQNFKRIQELEDDLELDDLRDLSSNEVFYPPYGGSTRLKSGEAYTAAAFFEKADKDAVFKDWYEFTKIDSFLGGVRRGWMIQPGAGSQHDGWDEHKILADIVTKICDEKTKEYEE